TLFAALFELFRDRAAGLDAGKCLRPDATAQSSCSALENQQRVVMIRKGRCEASRAGSGSNRGDLFLVAGFSVSDSRLQRFNAEADDGWMYRSIHMRTAYNTVISPVKGSAVLILSGRVDTAVHELVVLSLPLG